MHNYYNPNCSSTAGTTVVKETVKNSFQDLALSFGGQVVGSFLPDIDIPLGDFSISLSPTIVLGKGIGAGAAVGISYNTGNFTFSYGFGITGFAKHYATGNSGTEIRNSFMVNYDDGKTGFSLGTNFWGGGVTDGNRQRTSILSFRSGDFGFSYENDGSPFNYAGKMLSNDTDIQRITARDKLLETIGRGGWPGGENSWGKERVWLTPSTDTEVYGRSGFTIHGGEVYGSAGCIDLGPYSDIFFRSLRLMNQHTPIMNVNVNY